MKLWLKMAKKFQNALHDDPFLALKTPNNI
jgi:hypothetical protein